MNTNERKDNKMVQVIDAKNSVALVKFENGLMKYVSTASVPEKLRREFNAPVFKETNE